MLINTPRRRHLCEVCTAPLTAPLQALNLESFLEASGDLILKGLGQESPGAFGKTKNFMAAVKFAQFIAHGEDEAIKKIVAADVMADEAAHDAAAREKSYVKAVDEADIAVNEANACAEFDDETTKTPAATDCRGPNPPSIYPNPNKPSYTLPKRGVYDPNAITGPSGAGASRFVVASQPLAYTVQFENDPTVATAPVQHVRVTSDLDPNVDPRSFRLGSFGFGSVSVTVPNNQSFFQTTLDETATLGVDVIVTASINVQTHQAFWDFQAIDPSTGQPPVDASVGFLPPNSDGVSGQGFVTYSVLPKSGSPSGTVVSAQATIYFDNNDPIDTPTTSNTLDAVAPTSKVAALPSAESSSPFAVSWSGTDDSNGSAVASYSIYVSDNGGAYTPWLTNTTSTTGLYSGTQGHSYSFFSLATDSAGNVEPLKLLPDASTSVTSSITIPDIASFVVNDGSAQRSRVLNLTLTFNSPVTIDNGGITLSQVVGTTLTPVTYTATTTDGGTTYLLTPTSGVSSGSLVDGNYQLMVQPGAVHSASDGSVLMTGAARSYSFFRLFGDVNGDGVVNLTDYRAFKGTYLYSTGQTGFNAAFDVNNDGTINATDYRAFQANYLHSVTS